MFVERMKTDLETKLLRIAKVVGLILAILIFAIVFVLLRLNKSVKNLERVDEDGYLYYAEYKKNYDNKLVKLPFTLVASGGCSCFLTHNENDEVITCRNYDLAHKDDDGNITGLNVVLRCRPKNKYQSISVCDACWFSYLEIDYYNGALDDGETIQTLLAFLPYLTMDGINEKGLTCSILALDIKNGESAVCQNVKGKDKILLTVLLRMILDDCATIDEAIQLANNYNIINMIGHDFHLFVTEKSGRSVAFEWRNNEFIVTETDAITNFYCCSDDANDVNEDKNQKEKFEGKVDTKRNYLMGYGHGYARFNTIIESLNNHLMNEDTYETKMEESEAATLLQNVKQEYNGTQTSYTQYSCIYNNSLGTLKIYSNQDYSKYYEYKVIE